MSPSPPVKPFQQLQVDLRAGVRLAAVADAAGATVGRIVAAAGQGQRPSPRRGRRRGRARADGSGSSRSWGSPRADGHGGRGEAQKVPGGGGRRTRQVPPSTPGPATSRATTRSGASAVLVTSPAATGRRARRRRRRPNARRSRSSSRSVGAAVDREDGEPRRSPRRARRSRRATRHVAVAGGVVHGRPGGSMRSTAPRACRAVSANGWKMVCRQAGPPVTVRIGAMTLASWAWQATPTRSAWRSRVTSRPPTTTASVARERVLDERRRLLPPPAVQVGLGAGTGTRRSTRRTTAELAAGWRRRAPTWSAVATTSSMKASMSTAEARKLARSPSDGS